MTETKRKEYSVTEASEASGMSTPRIMRRIRNSSIEARKVGWVWIMSHAEMLKLKKEIDQEKKSSN